jgi:hypothetical protein
MLTPVEGKVKIDVEVGLAGILTLTSERKKPPGISASEAYV